MYRFIKKMKPTSRQTYLLVSLVAIIFIYPAVAEHPLARYLLGFLFATTPLTGIYAVSDNRRVLIVGTILGIPALLSIIGHFFWDASIVNDELYLTLIVVYYWFTTVAIIRNLFKRRKVDLDTILSAVSTYLMIGLSFSVLYMLTMFHTPGSFTVSTAGGVIQWHDMIYYSFVTLTTLGYGDITPLTPHARSLSILEAACGVMYMAILIARLVSEYQHGRD
jgi:voltage-gated potassium channel